MDKAALKLKIRTSIEELELKVLDLKELTKPIAPENAIGRVSRMDAINNKAVNEMALRQCEFKLNKLKLALVKIDEDYFGKCSRCGQDIQEGRVMLLPENTLCIRCASR